MVKQFTTSADGTKIAYVKAGKGPALVLVDGALCYIDSGVTPNALPIFANHFTVYAYDRRGRGDSGDTAPYSVQKEIGDLQAVLNVAGPDAIVLGFSSGAALAFYAAAAGVKAKKFMLYEAPFTAVDESDPKTPADPVGDVQKFIQQGDRKGATNYFMKDIIGIPGFVVAIMNVLMRKNMELGQKIAHTLAYDFTVLDQTKFGTPVETACKIRADVTVLYGEKTAKKLVKASKTLAGAIPNAKLIAIPNCSHMVKAKELAPVILQELQK